jgi:hypothetical protein
MWASYVKIQGQILVMCYLENFHQKNVLKKINGREQRLYVYFSEMVGVIHGGILGACSRRYPQSIRLDNHLGNSQLWFQSDMITQPTLHAFFLRDGPSDFC